MITIHNVFKPWPLEDKSVQAIITSPPFWSLRKYDIPDVVIGNNNCEHEFDSVQSGGYRSNDSNPGKLQCQQVDRTTYLSNICNKCGAYKGQHGLEPTYQQYIEHTRLWAKEAWRVLRDDGCFFLNLGDSYSASGGQGWTGLESKNFEYKTQPHRSKDLKPKCKILIPHRVAISLIDAGWILRNDICWYKPNSMPESCRDRFSKKFEYIFMFTKQLKYYFDLDSVREEHQDPRDIERRIKKTGTYNQKWLGTEETKRGYMENPSEGTKVWEIGKNPGDCWTINTQPSPFKHYAMFPEKLVERMILCSTKKGDMVLDPFCGSATTLAVAERLNRKGIGFDLGYEDIQKVRLTEIQKELL